MSQYRIISLSYWISTFCEGASRIIIPLYFASIGVSVTKIAVLFFTFELLGLVTSITSGVVINRFGYKFSFMLSLVLHSVASFGYLGIGYGPFWLTVILVNGLRGMRGVAKELIKTASASYLKHLPKRRHSANILLGGKDFTKGVGLMSGGVLLTYFSFKMSLVILGVLTIFMFILSMKYIEDFREENISYYRTGLLPSNKMIKLACLRGLLYSGRDLWIVVALPVYLMQMQIPHVQVGIIIAIGLVIFGLVQPATSFFVKWKGRVGSVKLKRKWTYEKLLSPAMFLVALVPIVLFFNLSSIWHLVAGVVIYNIFSGIATTPHNFLHIKFSARHRASLDIAFYKTMSQIGKVISVFLSGILYDYFHLEACLLASFICLLIGFVLTFFIPPRKKIS